MAFLSKSQQSINETGHNTEGQNIENHIVKRSILEIFDTKEEEIIEAESFFKRPEHELIHWRRIFEESLLAGEHRFICTNCKQDVKIAGRKYERGQIAFFSHLHDSDYCVFKTCSSLSKEQIEAKKYGLIAESERHKRLKSCIYEALKGHASQNKGVTDVFMEKRVKSDLPFMNWRKPDVMAKYNDLNIVFELQLSTTFISVVVQRDIFYRLNDYFIVWVFNFDDNQKYVDLTNLMCKDIYYANKRNIFIFDAEAQQASEERGELVLKCNWLDTDNTWHFSHAKGNGDGVLITIDELKYDEETAKPYYFDAETPYYEKYPEVKERIKNEEKSKQELLDKLQERAALEAEKAIILQNDLEPIIKEEDYSEPIIIAGEARFKVKCGNLCGIKTADNQYIFIPRYRDITTREDCSFVILKVIKYKKEREYTNGRSYHMIDREYNEYQLFNINGTQDGIPDKYRRTYSKMSFINSRLIWLDSHILSLDDFAVSENVYNSCELISPNDFVLVQNRKYGLLDTHLKPILKCEFDSISEWGNGLFLARKDIRTGGWYKDLSHDYYLYKKDGTLCSIGVFERLNETRDGRIKITKDKKAGYIDHDGEIVSDRQETINNEIIVTEAFGSIEVKNTDGDILIPISENIQKIKPLTDGFYIIEKDNRQGILNIKDRKRIDCDYTAIELWSDGIFLVSKYFGFSLIASSGDNITSETFTKISAIENGFAEAVKNGVNGKLDCKGREVYDMEETLNDFLIKKKSFGKWGVFDKEDYQILPCQWDEISLLGDAILTSSFQNTKYSLFTLNGEKALPDEYSNIQQCSDGSYIATHYGYAELFNKDYSLMIPYNRKLSQIREWADNKYIAKYWNSYEAVIDETGKALTDKAYTKIGNLQDGKAEVILYGKTGYINEDCEEIPEIIENRGEWSIAKSFEKYSIIRNGDKILSDLYEASFLNNSLIKYTDNYQKSHYSLYSTTHEGTLPIQYKSIESFDGEHATVVNMKNFKGYIDEEGRESYDATIELDETTIAKRKLGKYDIFYNDEIILKDIIKVSKWDECKLKVRTAPHTVQIFSIDENRYLGECYTYIEDLKEGVAKVTKDKYEGYIDAQVNEIIDEKICIDSDLYKVRKLGRWYLFDEARKTIIDGPFNEIGSYRGKLVKFLDRDFDFIEQKTDKIIPVYGNYQFTAKSTLVYAVGERRVMIDKNVLKMNKKQISDFIEKNKTLKLVIGHINLEKKTIYTKPYKEELPPYEIGDVVKGEIKKVLPFGLRITCEDGRTTLIHTSRLNELGYGDYKFEPSQKITLKKTGFNKIHKNDIWEILSIFTL